jgi:hypothetical protein
MRESSSCAENFGSGRALHALNFAGAKLACADGYDNFGFGRALHALNFAGAKLACAEVQRGPGTAGLCVYG